MSLDRKFFDNFLGHLQRQEILHEKVWKDSAKRMGKYPGTLLSLFPQTKIRRYVMA